MSSSPSSILLRLNYHQFSLHPISTIKQHLTQNVKILNFKQSSIVNWDQTVLVEVEYESIPINPFQIYYVNMKDIKHLIPNSEKYVCVVNGCQVKLVNPRLNNFKEYLPIKIRSTIIPIPNSNTEDLYIDNELKTNATTPIQYFGTTVIQPMNALCTPMMLIEKDLNQNITQNANNINDNNNTNNNLNNNVEQNNFENNLSNGFSLGFSLPLPEKLYPSTFKPTFISAEDNLKNYKQCLMSAKLLSNVDNVVSISKLPDDIPTSTTTAYVCDINIFTQNSIDGNDGSINGIILIQPKRIPTSILWYPTNAYRISKDELESIKRFIEFDLINYTNYQYIKNK